MTSFVPRSPHAAGAAPVPAAARNAALLIDFDNITLGVRSDLGKELRTLLNSEIFSGKVAVRRAYADWRRYPNYVVPLTEASVDLIFAPAYGTSKKNATDLRMAVDAIELAFMRPELGTFILLTGDSDFTSCVVKLKEYGKYVIGVGMRDSSSDLLIQNCDEYYSYHALSGLVREGDQGGSRKDPWLLVREAVQKMAAASDSMRTDRLKQVMIDLDPNFDEKDEGYSKFSKFVQVAAEKGLIRLHKVENGQFEVAPADDEAPQAVAPSRYDREERYRDRDRGRGRGRGRDRDRDRDRDRERGPRAEYTPPAAAEPEREERAEAPVRLHRDEEERTAEPAEVAPYEPAGPPLHEEPPAAPTPEERDARTHAYALLQHAVRALVSRQGQTARDGDVKRRMMEMDPGFDEHALGFSKFSRFLRQAHEDQVVDVRRLAEGRYEVALPSAGTKLAPPTLAAGPRPQPIHVDHEAPAEAADTAAPVEPRRDRDRGRGRGRGRGGAEGAPSILPGQTPGVEPARTPEPAQPAAEAPRAETPPRREPEPEPRRPEPTPPPAVVPVPATPSSGAPEPPRGLGHRNRGRRPAWASPSGPPPLLPGQVIHVPGVTRHAEPPQPETRAEEPSAPAAESAEMQPTGRRDRDAERAPATEAPQTGAPAAFDPASLGLPADRAGVEAHLSGYRGVGAATVRTLVDRFGDNVFQALEEDPDGIRNLLGRRAGPLLEQWAADRDARIAERPAPAAPEPQPAAADVSEDAREFAEAASTVAPEPEQGGGETEGATETEEHRSRRRNRRGGRNRNRRGGGDASAREAQQAVPADEAPATTQAEASPRSAAEDVAAEAVAAPTGTGRRGRRGQGGREETPAETVSVGGVDLPVGAGGETDPTLMEQATLPAGDAQPRGRSRSRGGRGRGGRAEAPAAQGGAASGGRAEAEAPRAEPAPAPAESPAASGGRSRRGRGRGGASAAAAPTPAPAPTPPAAEAPAAGGGGGRRDRGGRDGGQPATEAPAPQPPAAEGGRAGRRGRGGRGGRGGGQPAEAPAPQPSAAEGGRADQRGRGGRGGGRPAAEAPTPQPPAAEGGRGGRGRGGRSGGGAQQAAPPAPAPEAPAGEGGGGGSRPRRNRGRGGRGRGGGSAAS